jgi:pimeloyl-ACP methyl ester carboxylesterase
LVSFLCSAQKRSNEEDEEDTILLKTIISMAVVSISIYFAIALVLIFSQSIKTLPKTLGEGLNFASASQGDNNIERPLEVFSLQNGDTLTYRYFPTTNEMAPLLVLLHGSGWHGGGYQTLANKIALSGEANVVVPDLRGHGPSPKRRGDLDYIGQFEDDIAQLISHIKKAGQKTILAGHSSGGGLAIRFSGGQHRQMIDAAVLIAPYLKHDAPTMRPNSGGWAYPLVRRTIGLSMLNGVGITALNYLPSIQFKFPDEVLQGAQGHTATNAYSFRLNTSYAPRSDYLKDIGELPQFLMLVGENDEAFVASKFEPTMKSVSSVGQYQIVSGTDHLGIVYSEETAQMIVRFLTKMN